MDLWELWDSWDRAELRACAEDTTPALFKGKRGFIPEDPNRPTNPCSKAVENPTNTKGHGNGPWPFAFPATAFLMYSDRQHFPAAALISTCALTDMPGRNGSFGP